MVNNNSKTITSKKVPAELRKEMSSFKKRNAVHKDKHCPSCLKAHIKKTAKTLGVAAGLVAPLLSAIDGNVGHAGFYMDNGELVRV